MRQPSRIRAELYLIGITVLWGSSFVFTKSSLSGASPLLFLCVRFSLAAVAFLPLLYRSRANIDPAALGRGALLGIFLFLGYAFQTVGIKYTSVSRASFITYTFALFVPPLQLLMTGKRLGAANIAGLAVVFVGMYFFTNPEGGGMNAGDWLNLAGAFFYAFNIVLMDICNRRSDTMVLTFVQIVAVALLSGICSPLLEKPFIVLDGRMWFSLLYLAIGASCFALAVQNRFQPYTTPTRAVIIYALEPLVSCALAVATMGERLTPIESAGGLAILAGILVSELWDRIPAFRRRTDSEENP
jgi:drug/metabolite transporter (DMT)-like permease